MSQNKIKKYHLPYFDDLLKRMHQKDDVVIETWGHHCHWGYWEQPEKATLTPDDFANAADNLTMHLCRLADVADGQVIMDVGCGFGGTVDYLNQKLREVHLTGVNIDERQLDVAKEKIQPESGNKVSFDFGDACDLDYPANSVDRLLALECIHHFTSREKFFAHAQRVLRPQGVMAISDFTVVPALLPAAKLLSFPLIRNWVYFGYCNVTQESRYRKLAQRHKLTLEIVDVTSNTLPSYPFIEWLSEQVDLAWYHRLQTKPGLRLMNWLCRKGWLRYQLFVFKKP